MDSKLKVFISVDMEGISGVVRWDDVDVGKGDYEYFRQVMTEETNAAVEGALAAGATEVVVRDAHDTACNILPTKLHQEAKLLRNWSGGPLSMMEGIDASFDAVVMVGYHAKANTPNGILKHTMEPGIADLSVNGVSLPEGGWNALLAGHYGVPVVFVSGDEAICDYSRSLLPNVHTVAVKQGIGTASLGLHPEKCKELVRAGVRQAIEQRTNCQAYMPQGPYRIEMCLKEEQRAHKASFYPGAVRVDSNTVAFESPNFWDCVLFFHFA